MSISKDTFDIFKEILSHHPNVNARNKAGETALYCIVANKGIDSRRKDYLDELIKYQPPDNSDSETKKKKTEILPCDMKMRYQQGKTILHIAIENENRSQAIIETIIEKSGLDIDVEDDNGDTPLHLAAQKEYKPAIQMLINLGCDPTQPNLSGRTAFSMTNPSIAPSMTVWMNEPEAVENREKRREEKVEQEKFEEQERMNARDEKLQESPNKKPESPSKTPKKNKQSILLAMTLGNGTLRNTQSRNLHGDSASVTSADQLSKTKKIKRVEARPWGGSKETAKFQRDIRLMVRKMKSDVRNELDEIKKSIRELRKTITGESDDEDEIDNNNSEINSFSDHESANTSNSQINNDNNNNLDATHESNNSNKNDSNEQNQSIGDDQVQIENQVNNELSQNSQVDVELSAGHEEEQNSEIKIESENKQDVDSELNKLLDDDSNNIAQNDSNNVDHSSFSIGIDDN